MNTDPSRQAVETAHPESSPWLVLICAFNEGGHLAAQLAKFPPQEERGYDVGVVDDGSTDGSTEWGLLQDRGVRLLIRRSRNEGLSPAIRAGLRWVLESSGYQGVVLMNGNNKDDPSAIPAFLQALAEGHAYVQGSRFARGGRAIRTPWMRFWAIRLVHAPLFSLAAGAWMTDTTNGFRAFSRGFLEDPRVRFDQERFRSYEVEQYLAWKAIRLGCRYCEIPVVREYPAPQARRPGGVTKIRPGIGHWQMIKPLLALLLRRY